jgi:hypothetical protein
MVDYESARLMPSGAWVVSAQFYVQAELPRALGKKIAICKTDQRAGQLAPGNGKAQLRADTGRLPRRQRDAWKLRTQSLYST